MLLLTNQRDEGGVFAVVRDGSRLQRAVQPLGETSLSRGKESKTRKNKAEEEKGNEQKERSAD